VSRRIVAVRPDGRLRLRVDLPVAVVELADRLAGTAGLDREAVLGDLASVGLAPVLAELADRAAGTSARLRLTALLPNAAPPHLPPDERNPGALNPGAPDDAFDDVGHQPNAAAIVPGTGPEPVTGSDGPAT
jgi:hypothetical protein